MSHVTCHVSPVTCHFFITFFYDKKRKKKKVVYPTKIIGQSGGASRWRVCYQRGLPRLVFSKSDISAETTGVLNGFEEL